MVPSLTGMVGRAAGGVAGAAGAAGEGLSHMAGAAAGTTEGMSLLVSHYVADDDERKKRRPLLCPYCSLHTRSALYAESAKAAEAAMPRREYAQGEEEYRIRPEHHVSEGTPWSASLFASLAAPFSAFNLA